MCCDGHSCYSANSHWVRLEHPPFNTTWLQPAIAAFPANPRRAAKQALIDQSPHRFLTFSEPHVWHPCFVFSCIFMAPVISNCNAEHQQTLCIPMFQWVAIHIIVLYSFLQRFQKKIHAQLYYDGFVLLCKLNRLLNKQSSCRWYATPSGPSCDVAVMCN